MRWREGVAWYRINSAGAGTHHLGSMVHQSIVNLLLMETAVSFFSYPQAKAHTRAEELNASLNSRGHPCHVSPIVKHAGCVLKLVQKMRMHR